MRTLSFILLGFFFITFSATGRQVNIIPQPSAIELKKGAFTLANDLVIGYDNASLEPAAGYLRDILQRGTGYTIQIRNGKGDISLSLSDIQGSEGAYELVVSKTGIRLTGNTYGGVISGISTLRQLLPYEIELPATANRNMKWTIPALVIKDQPRFSYRGLHLDVSRHFYSKKEVEDLLDLMALYKLNKFHWHLTDDQGWRIEIKRYPLLTEKGAWRKFNNQDLGCMELAKEQDNPDFGIPSDKIKIVNGDTLYGGFYTQDDIREVVAYAKVRGIDIMPEIDMPGHFLAAIQNYDSISCFPEHGWGPSFSSPVCPGKESAMNFCKNVYSEVFSLFPYDKVHLGADEVDKTNWKKCPDCQRRIRENGLKNEEELQAWFVKEMEKFFNAHGKKLVGWDEIEEGGLSPTATIMWWRGWVPQAVPMATATGNEAIITTTDRFYFDYQQDKNTLAAIYNYEPVMNGLSDKQKKLIIGVQANVWTEYIPTVARMQYMIMPRMMALSEICWVDPAGKNLKQFENKVYAQFPRLDDMKINYRIPDMQGFFKSNMFIGKTRVKVISGYPKASIHYTTDGTFPTLSSPLYKKPVRIDKTTHFMFRYFRPDGRKSDIYNTTYIKGEYSAAKDTVLTGEGLLVTWHEYRGNSCREIEKAPVNGQYTVSDVSIPANVKGNIGLVITGYMHIPAKGIYTFRLLSDDGSILYIDGEQVIDNDGPHSPREVVGMKAFKPGWHPVKVLYFDSNGGTLKMKITDAKGNPVPQEKGFFMH